MDCPGNGLDRQKRELYRCIMQPIDGVDSRHLVQEVEEVLSALSLSFIQMERSGKCCHGVTLSQCHTLSILLKRGGLIMNELSKQMGLTKSTMTRIVNNLVRDGWVEQAREQRDRRLVSVRLTQKGKEMAETLNLSSRDCIERILKHIPQEKVGQVVESLKWIVQSIEKETYSAVVNEAKID
jgi:MarR family transcriptional regulator, organic hydroperoxide resistance regulator